jgi:hypothetical protein
MLKPHRHKEPMRQAICRAKEPRPEPVSLCEAALAYSLIGIACCVGAWGAWMAFVYVWAIAR